MTTPQLSFNYLAMFISLLAAFIFGFLWYGPLFGKIWARLIGMNMEQRPDSKVMIKALTLQVIGLCLTIFVLSHTVQVWRPSVWGVGADDCSCKYGFCTGLFTWLGFYVPLQLSKVSWENRPWKLFLINTGHDFINLQVIAQILANWR